MWHIAPGAINTFALIISSFTIVQALRDNESLTESAIKKLWPDESQVEKALKTLLEDQLIQALPRRRYRLPQ